MSLIRKNFFFMPPSTVTEAQIVSSIPDAENQVFDSGTVYAEGELSWFGGNVWRRNSDAQQDPGVGGWDDLGQVDFGAIAYDAGTTYAASTESVPVYAVYQGAVWASADDGNTGNTPDPDDDTKWVKTRATNRYKAFDTYLQDPAELPDEVKIVLRPGSRVTSVIGLRLAGQSIRVQMEDDTDGPVYDKTSDLIAEAGRTNLYRYLFTGIDFSRQAIFSELPPYSDPLLTITITGSSPKAGQLIFGNPTGIGTVETGGVLGLEDFSVETDDGFGRVGIKEGAFSDLVDFPVVIPTDEAEAVKQRLVDRKSKPTVFFMSNGAKLGLVNYGRYRELSLLLERYRLSRYLLQTRGLT